MRRELWVLPEHLAAWASRSVPWTDYLLEIFWFHLLRGGRSSFEPPPRPLLPCGGRRGLKLRGKDGRKVYLAIYPRSFSRCDTAHTGASAGFQETGHLSDSDRSLQQRRYQQRQPAAKLRIV